MRLPHWQDGQAVSRGHHNCSCRTTAPKPDRSTATDAHLAEYPRRQAAVTAVCWRLTTTTAHYFPSSRSFFSGGALPRVRASAGTVPQVTPLGYRAGQGAHLHGITPLQQAGHLVTFLQSEEVRRTRLSHRRREVLGKTSKNLLLVAAIA